MPNKNTLIEKYNKLLEKYRESNMALIEEYSVKESIDIEKLDAEIKELREQFEKAAGDSEKHGHWIVADDGVTRCSICYGASDYERSFCGDCGAKMDGGADK